VLLPQRGATGPARRRSALLDGDVFYFSSLGSAVITICGDGLQSRAFRCVDDLIDGLIRLMKTPDGVTAPLNLGNAVSVQTTASGKRQFALALPSTSLRRSRANPS